MKKEQFDFKEEKDAYGTLLSGPDMKLHRGYFDEMVRMIGIKCIYQAPKHDKYYSQSGELESNYADKMVTGCIFSNHPDPQTLKKIGWVSELDEKSSLIHVPYDLPGLQVGALFIIPDALNPKQGKLFRVVKMSTRMIYPSSVVCEVVPEYKSTFERSQLMFKQTDMNLLNEED